MTTVEVPAAPEPVDQLSDERYAQRLLPTVIVAVIAFSMSMTIVSAALPTIAKDLDSTVSTLSWAVTGLFLTMAIGTPVAGKIGDLFGHRRVFLTGATVLTLGTLACGFSWSAGSFIAMRMVVGLGISATMPTSMALIMDAFPVDRRPVAMGWYQMAMTGAPVLGLVVGGPMIEAWGWRTVFLMLAPIALAGLIASFFVLRSTPGRADVSIDWSGAALLGIATLAFLMGLERMKSAAGWSDLLMLGLFFAAVAATVLFVQVEKRVAFPLLKLEYFRVRNFVGPILAQGLGQFAYMGGFLITPLLLETRFGYGVKSIALILLFRPGFFSLMSPLGGRLAARFGLRPLIVGGSILMVSSMAAFAGAALTDQILLMILGLSLSGVAMGLSSPSISTAIAGSVDPADLGVANGMGSTMMNMGMLTGIQVMFVLLGEGREAGDFAQVFGFGGLVAACAIGGGLLIQEVGSAGERSAK